MPTYRVKWRWFTCSDLAALQIYTSLAYWDDPPTETLWWRPHVRDFHVLPPEQIPSVCDPPIDSAAAFTSIAVDVPTYLSYLVSRIEALGGTLQQVSLPTTDGFARALGAASDAVGGRVDCFVNATGLGAKALCGDQAVYPIRGQTVVVKGEGEAIRTRVGKDYVAYCIPRPGSGTTVLGGTRGVGDWSGQPDEKTTKKILERCGLIAPELLTGDGEKFEVLRVNVGLRPGRVGGARMEGEVVGGQRVVHAYGHAGAGFQNSVGVGRKVVQLVEESSKGDRTGPKAKL
ncbi:D-amino acid oxidase [Elasticomyces elasticus]|nr:D-amino acid oxidase [Elasticomyces elasticus]